jgi:hypothetical protein
LWHICAHTASFDFADFISDNSNSEADDEDEDFIVVLEHRGVEYTILGELGQGTCTEYRDGIRLAI